MTRTQIPTPEDLQQQAQEAAHRCGVDLDAGSGERTELSFATLHNWVSKTANLLLDATGLGLPRARLADFGIAAGVDQPRLTHVAHVVGTVGYAAPETLRPGWDPDPRADLYAAGMTAAEMLLGERPGQRPESRVQPRRDPGAPLEFRSA